MRALRFSLILGTLVLLPRPSAAQQDPMPPTSRLRVETINTRFVDAYWTFDVMASYPISEHIDLKLNLYNLADKLYFDRIGGGHIVPGPGRAAVFGAGFRF